MQAVRVGWVLLLLWSEVTSAQPLPEDCNLLQMQAGLAAHCRELKAAEMMVARGEAREAIPRLERLTARDLDQIRNYQPHRALGLAYCAVGDRKAARRHFGLYDCALAIDFAQRTCWIGGEPANGINPDIPQDCRRVACGEAFIDEPEAGRSEKYATLWSVLANDRLACGLRD